MDAFLEKLDPKTRKRVKMASETFTEMLPSASLEFNWATGGGFPRGNISTVFGNYSSSKTALVLQTIALLQKQGLICGFISAEAKFDKAWAARLGVDTEKLIIVEQKSFGAIIDEITPYLKAGIDFLAWDSISQTLPEVFVDDKTGEMKEFGSQKQIGAASRSAGIAINAMHYVNDRTAIVLISQTRTDMSGMHPMQKPTNGKAVEFGSALMVKLTASPSESQQIKGKKFIGDKIHELPVGREVKIDVVKNKVGPPSRTGKYNFYYDEDEDNKVGIDNVGELVSMAIRFGVVSGTTWLYYGEDKWQGSKNLTLALKGDPDLYERVKADVLLVSTGEVQDEQLGEVSEATTAGW